MKVILQKDVKDLGKIGQVVDVSNGYARNFLFPRSLAQEATESRIKEWQHLQRVAEVKNKKALQDREEMSNKINGVTVDFKVQAGEGDKLYGSISAGDISVALEGKGFSVDKRDIQLEPIKILGQHKAVVSLDEGLSAEIVIAVEKA